MSSAVERLWYARGCAGYAEEKILPSGNAVILVNLADPFDLRCSGSNETMRLRSAWLCGAQERFQINRPLGETHVIGATLRPLGLTALFPTPASHFTNRITLLEDLWGADVNWLRDQVSDATTIDGKFNLFTQYLIRHLAAAVLPSGLCSIAIRALSSQDPPRVGALCAELEVSRKHLNHLLRAHCGLSPSTVVRLARFNRFLNAAWSDHRPDFARIADQCGYYDQPHMNRDFRDISGTSPSHYMRRHRQEFGDDAGTADNRLFMPGT